MVVGGKPHVVLRLRKLGNRFVRYGPEYLLACVGFSTYMGLPMILGSLSEWRGYTDQQLGLIASALMFGLFLGSVLTSWLIPYSSYRARVGLACTVGLVSNVFAALTADFVVFLPLLLIGSIAGGVCYSSAVAKLAADESAVEGFSFLLAVIVVVGSLEIAFLPLISGLLMDVGVLMVLGIAYLCPLLLLFRQPGSRSLAGSTENTELQWVRVSTDSHRLVPLLCLVTIVAYFLSASSFWAYAERMGNIAQLSSASIGATLSLANMATLAACLVATSLSRSFSQYTMLVITMLATTLVFLLLAVKVTPVFYILGVIIFFQAWAMASIYQFSTLSLLDSSGRYVALIPGAQGVGQAAGPFLSALVLGTEANYAAMLLFNCLFLVFALMTYIGIVMFNGKYSA
ncbi:hypothetical protein CWI75_07970 [Kineobactrum sediminis]|uniref:MFS transporter n=2 Tax=Kineobactrum sediminis TaxID=1905677 RepID=A0A2N5Y4L7_9GAMM|nr:hypothetical protein CWI75_07970 [Kineobactrum sediminis]